MDSTELKQPKKVHKENCGCIVCKRRKGEFIYTGKMRKKQGISLKEYNENPEVRLKKSREQTKRYEDPAERKRTSDDLKKAFQRPEVKKKHKEGCNKESRIKRLQESTTGLWKDKDYKEHMREAHRHPYSEKRKINDYVKQFLMDFRMESNVKRFVDICFYYGIILNDVEIPKDGVENQWFVRCQICKEYSKFLSNTHLKKHDMTITDYVKKFTEAKINPEGRLKNLSVCAKRQSFTINHVHPWNGGAVPSYGYNWNTQRKRALERNNDFNGLTNNGEVLLVHHIIGVRDFYKRFLKIIYPELYNTCRKNEKFFGMFETKIRKGHKNHKHFKGIPLDTIFPNCFYDELNSLDNLTVLTDIEHTPFEGMPIGFFDAIRRQIIFEE